MCCRFAFLALLAALVGCTEVKIDPRAAAAEAGTGENVAHSVTADAEPLGFSRFLPEDVDGYASLLNFGPLRRSIADTKAWRELESDPEIGAAFSRIRAAMMSEELPPEARKALELLAAAGESEITVATRPDVSKNVLAAARLGILSVALFAPSPRGDIRDLHLEKREELAKQWAETIGLIEVPSFVVAARVSEPEKYDAFLQTMVELGWQGLSADIAQRFPAESRAAWSGAVTKAKHGKTTLMRFRLRLGDVVPRAAVTEAFAELPLGEADQQAAATAIENLTLDIHLGFIGEYLTLVVSSDDRFVREIVERHEGRSTATLAASTAFEPIRRELNADAVAVLYTDSTASRRELLEKFLPLVGSLADPQSMRLLGAPPDMVPVVQRMHSRFVTLVAKSPVRQHAVVTVDRGLRHVLNAEYDRDPIPTPTEPLTTPDMVPPTVIAYAAARHVSLDAIWDEFRFVVEQSKNQFARLEAGATTPESAASLAGARAKLDALIKVVDGKLAPSMQGEGTLVLGQFVPFKGNPDIQLSIPSVAFILQSPDPDLAIDGLSALIEQLTARPTPGPRPIALETTNVDGIDMRVLKIADLGVEGVEPHFGRLGDSLLISTSFDLTRQIVATTRGGDSIRSTAGHRAVAAELPPTAHDISYVDGETLLRNLRGGAALIFAYIESDEAGMSDQNRVALAKAKHYVELGLRVASTFRGASSSIVVDGKTNVTREWLRFEDLK